MYRFVKGIYTELGLDALARSPRDTKVLIAQRFIRLIAYGSSTLVLTLFLTGLGYEPGKTGLFMTLTLWGDVVISLLLTVVADGIGRRTMLTIGSLLMVVSGIVFALCSKYWVLVLASIVGIISPSGNEIGPFKAIEESVLSQLVDPIDRGSVLAWYTMSGAAGAATGVITFGWIVDLLQRQYHWSAVESYRVVFWVYACFGLLKALMCLLLSSNCELAQPPSESAVVRGEQEPLLRTDSTTDPPTPNSGVKTPTQSRWRTWLPELSRHTIGLLLRLGAIFALDSLGSGIASPAWIVFFFNRKFGLQEGKLGTLFFVTNLLSSASSLVAASLARRIGLIKTMVFTHLPASILLGVLPLPSNQAVAMAFLIARSSITSMDQAPRQAFLAAAVLPEERTTVMGIVNVLKTLSQSIGPFIAGSLANVNKIGLAFIIAGALKCGYDILLLGMFLGYRTVEEKATEDSINNDASHHSGRDRSVGGSP